MPLVNTAPPLHTPKQRASTKTKGPEISPAQSKQMQRAQSLNGISQIIQAGLMMTGQFADAGAFKLYSPGIAYQAAAVAEDHEKFANFLDQAEVAAPYIALSTASIPLLLQLGANHGRVNVEKASGMGVVEPHLLETQMKHEMARVQHEAMKRQREMDEALQREMQEMAREQEYINQQVNGVATHADV